MFVPFYRPGTNKPIELFVMTMGGVRINLTVHWLVGSVSAENVDLNSVQVSEPDRGSLLVSFCGISGFGQRSSS